MLVVEVHQHVEEVCSHVADEEEEDEEPEEEDVEFSPSRSSSTSSNCTRLKTVVTIPREVVEEVVVSP